MLTLTSKPSWSRRKQIPSPCKNLSKETLLSNRRWKFQPLSNCLEQKENVNYKDELIYRGQILSAGSTLSGQSSTHLAPLQSLSSQPHPTQSFIVSIVFPFFHPSFPFRSLPLTLPPSSPHSVNSLIKYLLNSYCMLICAMCWRYSGKQSRRTIPSEGTHSAEGIEQLLWGSWV